MKNLNINKWIKHKLLWLVAYILIFILTWVNKKAVRKVYKTTAGYDYRSAYNFDKFGNSEYPVWLNKNLLISSSKHHFGSYDETISSVLGKNQRDNTLSKFGDKIRRVVDKLDKSVDNHCLHWINEDVNFQHDDFEIIKQIKN